MSAYEGSYYGDEDATGWPCPHCNQGLCAGECAFCHMPGCVRCLYEHICCPGRETLLQHVDKGVLNPTPRPARMPRWEILALVDFIERGGYTRLIVLPNNCTEAETMWELLLTFGYKTAYENKSSLRVDDTELAIYPERRHSTWRYEVDTLHRTLLELNPELVRVLYNGPEICS